MIHTLVIIITVLIHCFCIVSHLFLIVLLSSAVQICVGIIWPGASVTDLQSSLWRVQTVPVGQALKSFLPAR